MATDDDRRKLEACAQRWLDVSREYWDAFQKVCGHAAVVWVRDTNGRMAVFTRGEYEHDLLENIESHHSRGLTFGSASDGEVPHG